MDENEKFIENISCDNVTDIATANYQTENKFDFSWSLLDVQQKIPDDLSFSSFANVR